MEQKIRIYNDIDTLSFNNEGDRLEIAGYAAHFATKNLNGEYCFKESFSQFFDAYRDGKIRPILNYEHQDDKQIGSVDEVTADDTGLYVKAHINKNIPWCRDWLIPNIEAGDIKSYSTEMVVIGGRDGVKINDDGSYVVLSALLTAVAVVKHPADWKSEFTVANFMEQFNSLEDVETEVKKSKWFLLV